jgi:hypothetical protein
MRTITIGADLAKQVCSVCSVDAAGPVEDRRDLRREAFRQWLKPGFASPRPRLFDEVRRRLRVTRRSFRGDRVLPERSDEDPELFRCALSSLLFQRQRDVIAQIGRLHPFRR